MCLSVRIQLILNHRARRRRWPTSRNLRILHRDLQAKALENVMKDVNARFGKGSLMCMGAEPDKIV